MQPAYAVVVFVDVRVAAYADDDLHMPDAAHILRNFSFSYTLALVHEIRSRFYRHFVKVRRAAIHEVDNPVRGSARSRGGCRPTQSRNFLLCSRFPFRITKRTNWLRGAYRCGVEIQTRKEMATPNRQPKMMSSRLLTMKFMQRASNSPSSAPSTPSEPPSKKQRLSNGSQLSPYNSSAASTPKSDAQTVEDALASEERKRSEAIEREAADRGESKWYLSYKEPQAPAVESPLRIVSAGYSALDASGNNRSSEEENEGSKPPVVGRRSFGNFNRTAADGKDDEDFSDSSASSESGDGDDDEDDPTGAKALIKQSRKEAGDKARAERKAKRKAEKTESLRLAEDRRKKKVKLNQLDSISGAGGSKTTSYERNMVCHQCGEKGHPKAKCPQLQRKSSRR